MRHRAFTLIELLVVVAIIALLSGVVLASLNSARAKARDARRLADVDTLVKAISMYFSDNGIYPTIAGDACIGLPTGSTCWGDRLVPGDTSLMNMLSPYIKTFPSDPLNARNWNDYYVYEDGNYAMNCNGATLDTGHFIFFRPDAAGAGSAFSCPLNTTRGCCPSNSSICASPGGYFCARKIDN